MHITVSDGSGRTRVIDLPPRPSDRPLIVGRDPACPIGLPLDSVAPEHCALFEQQGQWYVQDLVGSGGTYLNGEAIDGAQPLQVGDVVSLGAPDAPAALLIGDPVPRAEAGSVVQPHLADLERALERQPISGAMPIVQDTRFYVPPQPRMSGPGLVAGGLAMLGLLIVGAIIIYFAAQRSREPIVVTPDGAPSAAAPTTTARRVIIQSPAAPTAPRPPTPAEVREALMAEPAWRRVEEAHRIDQPPQAILAFEAYRAAHPNTPLADLLDAYTDEALDRLWWRRIIEVMNQRDDAAQSLENVKQQIKQSDPTPPRLIDERDRLEQAVQRHQQVLDEMGYTHDQPPDPYDDAALEALRTKRDDDFYAHWKEQVLTSIRETRGAALPW